MPPLSSGWQIPRRDQAIETHYWVSYRVEVHQNQLLTISVVALRDLPRQHRHLPGGSGTGSARPR